MNHVNTVLHLYHSDTLDTLRKKIRIKISLTVAIIDSDRFHTAILRNL
jgi:hypothetical protein